MIQTTVGLPVWNSKSIAFVAMEGLIRQQGCVNPESKEIIHEWELIIAEEQIGEFCGQEFFNEYAERLRSVGCTRVIYLALDKWLPLPQKWRLIAQNATYSSEYFILQAADCYPEPMRIINTALTFEETGADWVQNQKGLFYWVDTGATVLYNGAKINRPHNTDLNMATRTKYVRVAEDDSRKSGIDHWLYIQVNGAKRRLSGGALQGVISAYNKKSDFSKGLDTHGLNNISMKRHLMFLQPKDQFSYTELKPQNAIDIETWERLSKLKRYTLEQAASLAINDKSICEPIKFSTPLDKNLIEKLHSKIIANYQPDMNHLKAVMNDNLPKKYNFKIITSKEMRDTNGNKSAYILIDGVYRIPANPAKYFKIR